MPKFAIITDSAADLDDQLIARLEVHVLPLSVTIQGETYFNHPGQCVLPSQRFFELLRQGERSSTSAVNAEQYTTALTPLLEAGQDVLILTLSSALSATYQSAVLAAEELAEQFPQRKVYVVDTLCVSAGEGLLVYLAAQKRSQGLDVAQVRAWAEETKQTICHHFTVDDLQFLKRGGRISATTAAVGSMLQIKPLLHVDEQGKLVNIGKARGRAGAIKALAEQMERTASDPSQQTVFISHGDCLDDAEKLADLLKQRLGLKEVYISYVGPIVGTHAGPGVLALFFLGSPR